MLIILIASLSRRDKSEPAEETTVAQPTTVVTVTTAAPVEVPANAVVEQNGDVWGLYENGNLVNTFTGIASNDLGNWYIKDGLVDFSYTGPVTYNNAVYNVVNGQVQ